MQTLFRIFGSAVTLATVLMLAGCESEQVLEFIDQVQQHSAAKTSPGTTPVRHTGDTIRIASFNIQVFGVSKSKKPHVMDVLAKVVRRFDVVAIQEIRSKDQTIIPKFVELINADGSHYDYVVGPRLGRTSSKEQYAFVYNSRIELDRNSVYTVEDPQDLLHRPPLVATFQVRGPPTGQAFRFTLVNIHTDPDDTDIELDALDDVFVSVRQFDRAEDDVIVLGDLNVDEDHLGHLGQLPNITWTVRGTKTNTRQTKSYDNLVFDRTATVEYTGQAGVLNLMSEFGLTVDQALEVSDHLPVWAEFDVYEGGRAPDVASRPEPATR